MLKRAALGPAVAAVLSPVLTAAALAGATPARSEAQTKSLTWTERTQLEVPGTLGMILRLTGATDPIVARSGLHLQGRALIQDYDQTTMVTDLDAGHFLSIDHATRSYTRLTFEEMGRLSEQAVESIRASSSSSGGAGGAQAAQREEAQREMEEARAQIEFRLSAETTGQRQRVGNYNATQHFITLEFEASEVPEGVDEPEGGSMYFITELWETRDVPNEAAVLEEWGRMMAADPRFRELAGDVAEAVTGGGEQMAASLAMWNPEVGSGLAELADELAKMDGIPVRTTMVLALVPLGVDLNRAELLAWQPASMGTQLRASAGNAARQATVDAARGAVRGLLGGRGASAPPPQPEPAADEPAAYPMLRMTTTREDLAYRESAEDLLGALDARIAGYRVQTYEDISRQLQQ